MKRRKKNDEVDNQIRCVASDCIIRLFESRNVLNLNCSRCTSTGRLKN